MGVGALLPRLNTLHVFARSVGSLKDGLIFMAPFLKHLRIDFNLRLQRNSTEVLDFVRFAIYKAPNLENLELRLSSLLEIAPSIIELWLPSLSQLHTLSLPSTPLTPRYIAPISKLPALQNLKWVNASSTEDPGQWNQVTGSFPSLKAIECVIDTTTDAVTLLDTLPKHQINSISLDLRYSGMVKEAFSHVHTLSEGIAYLGHLSLKVLHLNLPRDIRDAFRALEPLTECLQLTELQISYRACLDIQDDEIEVMAQRLRNLQTIVLGPPRLPPDWTTRVAPPLTLRSIQSFADHCPDITSVGLLIGDSRLPKLHRNDARFLNDMTFEFFTSKLEVTDVFPVAKYLTDLCRAESGVAPVLGECIGEEWKNVGVSVREFHSVRLHERRWVEMKNNL